MLPRVFRKHQDGYYKGPGQEIEDDYLHRVVQAPDGHIYVYFKGTRTTSYTQWKQNFAAAFRGERVPEWDRVLNECRSRYGYQSKRVSYTGFSRGSVLAQVMGGTGYGLGRNPFPSYPPRPGSKWERSFDPVHDAFMTEFLYTTSRREMGVYGNRRPDETSVVDNHPAKKPHVQKEEPTDQTYYMPAEDARNPFPWPVQIRFYRDGFWYFDVNGSRDGDPPRGWEEWDGTRGPAVPGQGYGNYDDLNALANSKDSSMPTQDDDMGEADDTPIQSQHTLKPLGGNFSGLCTTFLDSVTGRIIGYKGIPRKRKFSSLEKYSPFWKEHNRLTQQSVLAGPSQA